MFMTDEELHKSDVRTASRVALQVIVKQSISVVLISAVLVVLGRVLLPSEASAILVNRYLLGALFVIYVISRLHYYKWLNHSLVRRASLRYLLKTSSNPIGDLKSLACSAKCQAALAEKSLDIWKVFSPMPVLMYGIGVLVGNQKVV